MTAHCKDPSVIARYLAQCPEGATRVQISAAVGLSLRHIKGILRRRRGDVMQMGASSLSRWYVAPHEETVKAAIEAARLENNAKHRAARTRKSRRRIDVREKRAPKVKPKVAKADPLDWFEVLPVHRVVSARDVPPLGRVGPCSVWEVAA